MMMNPQGMPGPLPAAPMPGMGPAAGGDYPAGADIMAQENAGKENIDNPVIAGFQSIVMLIGELAKKNDPRAQPAAEALKNLLSILGQGAGGEPLPMSPPSPEPAMTPMPEAGPGPMAPPAPGPMPGAMAPTPGPMPAPAPAPAAPMFNEAAPPAPGPKVRPMMKRPGPPINAGKQPTVLT